jgi:hypothetical protein
VTGMAMADIAGLIIDHNKYSKLKNAISKKISDWEINMIDADSVNGENFAMTKYEFLLFTLLRLNIVEVDLIDEIFEVLPSPWLCTTLIYYIYVFNYLLSSTTQVTVAQP